MHVERVEERHIDSATIAHKPFQPPVCPHTREHTKSSRDELSIEKTFVSFFNEILNTIIIKRQVSRKRSITENPREPDFQKPGPSGRLDTIDKELSEKAKKTSSIQFKALKPQAKDIKETAI